MIALKTKKKKKGMVVRRGGIVCGRRLKFKKRKVVKVVNQR